MEVNLKNKKILFVLQRDWGIKHGFEIIKKLKKNGALISVVIFKKSTENFVKFQKDVEFENILEESFIEKNSDTIIKKNNYSAEKFLDDFNVKSVWEFIHTLRGKATSYKEKFPFSYKQNLSDDLLKKYIIAFGTSLINLYEKFKPDLVIFYNYGDIRHHLIAQLSHKNNIPFFYMNDTKVKNIAAFFYDLNRGKSFFHNKIEDYNDKKIKPKYLNKAIEYLNENRQKIQNPMNIKDVKVDENLFNLNDEKNLLKTIFRKIKIKNEILDYSERISFLRILKNYFYKKKNILDMKFYKFDKLEHIENFVFLPLQHEPETIGMCNPIFDNQFETARILARNLPKNYCLAVKIHPFRSYYRSKKFMDKFKNYPNIKIISHKVPNEKIFKKMNCLISFSGTAIFEAAILKKPAVQIGNMELMKNLPNIFFLEKLQEIDQVISKLENSFQDYAESKSYDEKLLFYISAAYETGFYFDKYQDDYRENKKSLDYMWSKYTEEINKLSI